MVFKLRSLDVIHSFFVPEFSEKLDAVPGITTTLRVTPTRIGTYPAECTELCGAGHSLMRATVHVVSPAAFRAWISTQKANGPPPVGTPPANAAQPGIPGAAAAAARAALVFELPIAGGQRRRGQDGLHRSRRLRQLPHAGGGGHLGTVGPEPRPSA